MDGESFRTIIEVFWASRAHIPKHIFPQIWKLCRSEDIRLRLVETDIRHCLAYLTVTHLVTVSRRNSSKLCKTKVMGRRERGGDTSHPPKFYVFTRFLCAHIDRKCYDLFCLSKTVERLSEGTRDTPCTKLGARIWEGGRYPWPEN